jgi:hypothetical protein
MAHSHSYSCLPYTFQLFRRRQYHSPQMQQRMEFGSLTLSHSHFSGDSFRPSMEGKGNDMEPQLIGLFKRHKGEARTWTMLYSIALILDLFASSRPQHPQQPA